MGVLLWSAEILWWTRHTIHKKIVQMSEQHDYFLKLIRILFLLWGSITFKYFIWTWLIACNIEFNNYGDYNLKVLAKKNKFQIAPTSVCLGHKWNWKITWKYWDIRKNAIFLQLFFLIWLRNIHSRSFWRWIYYVSMSSFFKIYI